jgi:F-type H+-transporting ATPase subunit gamma
MESVNVHTLEALQRRVRTAEDLHSVVRTMKALAAVSIRQYEKAVESLTAYQRTVELGLRIVLTAGPNRMTIARLAPRRGVGTIVFGSDQGMCGQLNEQIASHAVQALEQIDAPLRGRHLATVGARVAARLGEAGQLVAARFAVPDSIATITPRVQELLLHIEAWHAQYHLDHVYLFYSRHLSSATYQPHMVHLLPVDQAWLQRIQQQAWPSTVLPTFTMERERLFSALIRQYLFVSLYQALAESLASEHASRLAAMQHADRNIQERLEELRAQFRQQRQLAITTELLDIVAGFEALTPPPRQPSTRASSPRRIP